MFNGEQLFDDGEVELEPDVEDADDPTEFKPSDGWLGNFGKNGYICCCCCCCI